MSFRFFFHLYSHKIFFWLFLITFVFQILFWKKTEDTKPPFEIIPPAPNQYLISTLSLGDKEFLFRILAARLQNSGDIFAGFRSLKEYDYLRIYQWMTKLDTLNDESNFIPALAAYIYSQTQIQKDVAYILDYLEEHCAKDIDKNWWWLFQATYIAKKNLGDMTRALKIAEMLSKNNAVNAPLWTKQLPAFLYEEQGESCMAFAAIERVIKESESGARQVTPEEMNFMRYFINERLSKLKKQKFDPRQCKNL